MPGERKEELRGYVETRVRAEVEHELRAAGDVPDHEIRAIVDESFRAGDEEIEYNVRRLVRRARKLAKRAHEKRRAKAQAVPRFSLSFRIQHLFMAGSVLLLIITGIPIKFHDTWLGAFVAGLHLVDTLKVLHRVAAAIMAVTSFAHVFWVVFSRDGWRNFVALLPNLQDVKDLWGMLRVLFGWTTERPRFARFNFIEKFDYWAVYWGVVIMLGTGTLLTFNTYFMNTLGPYSMQIAKLIHSDEALLASLALIIWHFYWAHFNPDKFPMNKTFLTGTMTVEEMIEEHPAELDERVRRGEIPIEALAEHPEWAAIHPEHSEGGTES